MARAGNDRVVARVDRAAIRSCPARHAANCSARRCRRRRQDLAERLVAEDRSTGVRFRSSRPLAQAARGNSDRDRAYRRQAARRRVRDARSEAILSTGSFTIDIDRLTIRDWTVRPDARAQAVAAGSGATGPGRRLRRRGRRRRRRLHRLDLAREGWDDQDRPGHVVRVVAASAPCRPCRRRMTDVRRKGMVSGRPDQPVQIVDHGLDVGGRVAASLNPRNPVPARLGADPA